MTWLAQLLVPLLARLPLAWVHRLGALAGWLAWLASPSYRRHLRDNLALAIPEPALRASAARQAIAAAGQMVFELPRIWLNPMHDVAAQIQVSGWEAVDAARQAGQPLVILTPHLGCFEIAAQYFALFHPITVLFRPPRQPYLQALMTQGRQRGNLALASADLTGVRALMRALRRGETIGLLPDQAPQAGEGRWLPFFGRMAYTMTLAARLTEGGATVLLAWVERLPGGAGYHFRLRPPQAALTGDTEARARQINGEIEALIRECPGQYLWGYNRYKQPRGAEPPPLP